MKSTARSASSQHPYLVALGLRVRALRSEQRLTRKQLSQVARISERHLANLEGGTGNVSVLILLELAKALDITPAQLLGEAALERKTTTGKSVTSTQPVRRIALIGLRGAGKSTLGSLLAKDLGYRFIETSREIESLAGCGLAEIYNLYGEAGYRRLESQAIRSIVAVKESVVIATPGGLVSNNDTFERLLSHCQVVWLRAKPLDHLSRVRAQGDNRPMAATRTTQRAAIDDLKSILELREPHYARAHETFNTSEHDLATCRKLLRERLQRAG